LGNFSIRRAGTYHGYCRDCLNAYLREWRARRRDAPTTPLNGTPVREPRPRQVSLFDEAAL